MTKARVKKPESAAISRHWRLMAAVVAGVLGWLAARHLNAPVSSHILIGWDACAFVYVVTTWRLFLTADEAEVRRRAEAIGRDPAELRAHGAAGTLAEVVETIGRYADVGVQRLYLQVLDLTDLDHLDLVAEQVAPHLAGVAQVGPEPADNRIT